MAPHQRLEPPSCLPEVDGHALSRDARRLRFEFSEGRLSRFFGNHLGLVLGSFEAIELFSYMASAKGSICCSTLVTLGAGGAGNDILQCTTSPKMKDLSPKPSSPEVPCSRRPVSFRVSGPPRRWRRWTAPSTSSPRPISGGRSSNYNTPGFCFGGRSQGVHFRKEPGVQQSIEPCKNLQTRGKSILSHP